MTFQNTIVLLAIGLFAAALHFALFKSDHQTVAKTLVSHPYMWPVYVIAGVLAAEHIFNFFRRRKAKRNQLRKD